MSIKTKIDKVPVEFEIKSVGPASIEDIDKFKEDLESGNIVVVKKSATSSAPISNPYLKSEDSDENSTENVLEVDKSEEVPLAEVVLQSSKDKPWWKSKTVVANIVTAAGCAIATFLTDNPEMATYLPLSVLAAINLVLRGMSKTPITIPFKDKISKSAKK